jgi:toxin-antitoxin system PIN domain toxin
VILPDVNILLYAYDTDSPYHAEARHWWESVMRGTRPVGLPWISLLGFIRISTHQRIFNNPLPIAAAVGIARKWVANRNAQILVPGEAHAEIVFGFLEKTGAAGNLTTDAHLAALAIEYKAEIATTARAFSRFPGLKWSNPLSSR